MKATETEIHLSHLIDNYDYKRQQLSHQINTATKLGHEMEVMHLRGLREAIENFGYELKALSEKYEKEKALPKGYTTTAVSSLSP